MRIVSFWLVVVWCLLVLYNVYGGVGEVLWRSVGCFDLDEGDVIWY